MRGNFWRDLEESRRAEAEFTEIQFRFDGKSGLNYSLSYTSHPTQSHPLVHSVTLVNGAEMGGKHWTTPAQQAFLQLQVNDYIERHAQKKLHLFWGPMQEAWFHRFSEHAALGFPLPSDKTAPLLTDAEVKILGDAIAARKKVSEIRNTGRKNHADLRARDFSNSSPGSDVRTRRAVEKLPLLGARQFRDASNRSSRLF